MSIVFARPNINPDIVAPDPNATNGEGAVLTVGIEAHTAETQVTTTAESEAVPHISGAPLATNTPGYTIADDGRSYGIMNSEWNGEQEYR